MASAAALAGLAYVAAPATATTATGSVQPAAATYASVSSAVIHPGVQMLTNGAQCTANFLYTDGTNTYLGQAAHCSGTGGNTATDGCSSPSLPLGTEVDVLGDDGNTYKGTMVYNSWLAMQAFKKAGGTVDANTCAYNDLALVQIPSNIVSTKVNPSVPYFGGPTGLDTQGTQQGDMVYSYGNSELRAGLSPLSPKEGISLGDDPSGWSHQVYTVTPGIPGDSGSGFLTADGKALGVLSTVEIAPVAGSNNVGDLAKELAWLNGHPTYRPGSADVSLVNGTQPFSAGIVGVLGF